MRPLPCCLTLLLALTAARAHTDPARILPPAQRPPSVRRHAAPTPAHTASALAVPPPRVACAPRRQAVRERILVAPGLWPMPPKTPLHPTVHGRIDRDGYSVEKVFFASHPG